MRLMQEKTGIINSRSLLLSALINRPAASRPCPAVLVLHGFTGFKEEEHIRDFAEGLAAEGFVALRFDASGFGESEGELEKDFRVTHYIEDIDTAIQFLSSLPYVDRNRLGVCGHSLGGGLALIAASKTPLVQACCAVQPSTVTVKDDRTYDLKEWEKSGWFEKKSEHPRYDKIRLPWAFALDRMRYDAIEAAAKVSVPLMIMYGTEDQAIDSEDCRRMFEAAKGEKELVELKGFAHDFKRWPEQRQRVTELLVGFFSQWIKCARHI